MPNLLDRLCAWWLRRFPPPKVQLDRLRREMTMRHLMVYGRQPDGMEALCILRYSSYLVFGV